MPSNWIDKNWLNMLSNTRMPICMKSLNILIVRQPPFAMHSNRWGWRAKKDHYLQRTRPGQSNALFDTAGRIFRLPTCLFGWNRIWPLPVPSLCPQPERANSESADKWKRYRHLYLVSAQVGNRLIAPMVYQNTMTVVFFEAWFQQCLLPALTQKSVIILDNARFHRMGVLREMAEKLGHKVLPLAPYSPELNPIEKVWANIKRYLRTVLSDYARFDDALLSYFYFNWL